MQNTATFFSFFKSLKCRLIVMAIVLAIIPSMIVGNGIFAPIFKVYENSCTFRETYDVRRTFG